MEFEKITGLIDAPFTPFTPEGDLNLEPIPAYANMLRANGMKGVFINGSSGEGYMLTDDERKRLAEAWIAAVGKNDPDFKVIVHVGSCCLRSSRELARHAAEIGAWGIGAMAPPLPQDRPCRGTCEIYRRNSFGCSRAPLLLLSYPPPSTALSSPMLDLLKAVDGRVPNFAGIKYTFESLYEYNQCRLYENGKFDMLHGQDETILASLAQGGARGGIGGTTNYNGRELNAIIEAWNHGDIEAAREHQNFSQEVINVICRYRGNIVGGKRIMKLIGLDLGPNRVPFRNMTDEEEEKMREELNAIDFFCRCNKL